MKHPHNPNFTICTAALLGFSAVLLGAFGAHALKTRLDPDLLAIFDTGCRYHLIHALAMLALSGLTPHLREQTLRGVARFWLLGIVVFSGSLYVLAITGVRRWGLVTPVGGLLLLCGWLMLFFGAVSRKASEEKN